MGKREPGNIYMHAMLWDPQKPGGAHIKGDISLIITKMFHIY